jgi:hypothetical protein
MTSPPPSLMLFAVAAGDSIELGGEQRSAAVGDVLFRVGDARYPLISILQGEAAILNAFHHCSK